MSQSIEHTEIILFVRDQYLAAEFYQKLLGLRPSLHVPGMTEFKLTAGCKLGLMPRKGIANLLQLENSAEGTINAFPKCELYLLVQDAKAALDHGLTIGAELVSPVSERDWGDSAGYLRDPDGHLIAFATKINAPDE